jgi:hypothetical protein
VALIPDSDEKADLDAPSDESGKLVVNQAPNITITSTTVVADEAERLALDVQEGDIAIQQDTTESFIFTGGANVAINWQLVQFDAVGGIAGEDISPRDINARVIDSSLDITGVNLELSGTFNGANFSGASAGEFLTSDGSGNLSFSSPDAGSEVTRDGDTIEYVALNASDLPSPTGSGDVGLLVGTNEYVKDTEFGPFDLRGATFDTSINSQDRAPEGIALSSDGSRLFELGRSSGQIYQSDLSTPFDITTASFDTSINTQDTFSTGIAFSADGSRLFEVGGGSNLIYQSDLSAPFDISTAIFDTSINTQDSNPHGITFSADGSRMFVVNRLPGQIYQSDLSTPFDITTASFDTSINPQDSSPRGIEFNADGSRLFEIGDGSGQIYQSDLSTPFDITTASFDTSINSQHPGNRGIRFSADGSRMFECSDFGPEKIFQSIMGGNAWAEL